MARGYTTRKLEVFALHVRNGQAEIDYSGFFRSLSAMPSAERCYDISDKIIAFPQLVVERGFLRFTAYEGERGLSPLIYDTTRGTERYEDLRAAEMVATKTHGLINLTTREAVIEFNQRGARANDIAQAIGQAAAVLPAFHDVEVELNPVADQSFVEAINAFDRIKIATLKIARPNFDWTDHRDALTEAALASNAQTVAVTMYATRSTSLSKSAGVVSFIKALATHPIATLKGARVTGTKADEIGDTTVSLAKHIEHTKVNVKMIRQGHVDDRDIEAKLKTYLNSRTRHRRE